MCTPSYIANLPVDAATGALLNVQYDHHETHDGCHFFYTDKFTLASAGTQVYLLTTPNTTKWAHIIFSLTGSAITQADLYEGADRTGVLAQTISNSNRNSATAATLLVHKNISGGTTDGSLIWTMNSGAATNQSRSPLSADRNNEIILKQNTKYLIRFTSGTNDNLCNIQLQWYEHVNKA